MSPLNLSCPVRPVANSLNVLDRILNKKLWWKTSEKEPKELAAINLGRKKAARKTEAVNNLKKKQILEKWSSLVEMGVNELIHWLGIWKMLSRLISSKILFVLENIDGLMLGNEEPWHVSFWDEITQTFYLLSGSIVYYCL